MDVAIVLFEGFEELDAIGPFEVFANAADRRTELSVSLRTLDGADRVTGSHGLRVEPDGRLDAVEPDVVVVPGGWNDRAEEGAWAEAERGALPAALAAHHADGATVAGVCTGSMLLERAGLLDGRPATTHAGAVDELRDAGADVVDARVVDDGDVVTAGGVTAGIDLAIHVVGRAFGDGIAGAVADTIEYEPQGRTHESRRTP